MFSSIEKHEIADKIFSSIREVSGKDIPSEFSMTNELDQIEPDSRQLAIFGASAYYWQLLSNSEEFDCISGHSLGFYAALYASGSVALENCIRLIMEVQNSIDRIWTDRSGGMASIIGLRTADVEEICSNIDGIHISNVNSATQTVISGHEHALDSACGLAAEKGALKITKLPVSAPLHSPLMEGIEKEIGRFLKNIEIKVPGIPVISHIDCRNMSAADMADTITTQLLKRVNWRDTIKTMRNARIDRFIEIGPSDILSKLVLWIERDAESISAEDLLACRA